MIVIFIDPKTNCQISR